MNLEDTIGLMCSDNYKDRMKAEYIQLVIRMKKLAARIEESDKTSPGGYHMRMQMNAMKYYRDALRTRMEMDFEMNVKSLDSILEED